MSDNLHTLETLIPLGVQQWQMLREAVICEWNGAWLAVYRNGNRVQFSAPLHYGQSEFDALELFVRGFVRGLIAR
jgi:hypothetical protein